MSTQVGERLSGLHDSSHLDWADAMPAMIIAVPELSSESLVQIQAENLFKKAGKIALSGVMNQEKPSEKPRYQNIHEAILGAARGEREAIKMLTSNVAKDLFERIAKAGFVIESRATIDENGTIVQHGQTDEQIQLNTLVYLGKNKAMLPRYMAETRNKFRTKHAILNGQLQDYWLVVISRCEDGKSDKELDEDGFFSVTKSTSVQATTQEGNEAIIQSAFVAGVKDDNSARHDYESVKKFGELAGVPLDGSAAQTIDTPMLIHKSLMPNGIVDVVEWLDNGSGGLFFGQDVPRQDYAEFRLECKKREEEMRPTVDNIVRKIISLAHTVHTPVEASQLLGKVVGAHMAKAAVKDERIDPRVFGTESAHYISYARVQLAAGNYEQAQRATELAVAKEKSSSCPGGAKRNQGVGGGIPDLLAENSGEMLNESESETIDDCDFTSKECPMCKKKDVKTVVRGGVFYGACGCDSKHGKRVETTESTPKEGKTSVRSVDLLISLIRESMASKPKSGKKPEYSLAA